MDADQDQDQDQDRQIDTDATASGPTPTFDAMHASEWDATDMDVALGEPGVSAVSHSSIHTVCLKYIH